MATQVEEPVRTPRERVLGGSLVLIAGLGLVTAINFAYNLTVARYLGPTAFGHTTTVYTLLVLVSAVTLSFQILTAKMVAQQDSAEAQSTAYRGLHLRGWAAGLLVAMFLLLFSNSITNYLNLVDPGLIFLLAIGTAFYVPLGARRGHMLGICSFRLLALNLLLEGLVRLGGSLLLILLGCGVRGVIAANAAAVVTAYLFASPRLSPSASPESDVGVPIAARESLQAAVFFAGQVVINNCDIVVVKHFFPSEAAGVYAAVAMVGRVVFAFSWAIVSSMFPIAAQTRSRRRDDHGILGIALLLVLAVCLVFALGLRLAPSWLWMELFGPQFVKAGGASFSSLMVLYALATGVYALSVVIIAYEMSRKIANTGWVQLVVSVGVIAGIYHFHSSLAQVIWVQVAIMVFLLICVAVPFFLSLITGGDSLLAPDAAPIRLRRRVPEDEVIAEFLRNDWHCPELREYQGAVARLLASSNFSDPAENQMRRALLFLRHGSLWRELPRGTEWYEAEIRSSDLHRIRVFPRAQWRKLANGDFSITQVAERITDAASRQLTTPTFRAKIEDLRDHVAQNADTGAILIIGLNESAPFTILDGNHRLVAALLSSPETVCSLRFFCGLSPRMAQCCWYRTNLTTLLRYATNLLCCFLYDPEQRVVQLLQRTTG